MSFDFYLKSVGYEYTRDTPVFTDPVTGEKDLYRVYWCDSPPNGLKNEEKILNSAIHIYNI